MSRFQFSSCVAVYFFHGTPEVPLVHKGIKGISLKTSNLWELILQGLNCTLSRLISFHKLYYILDVSNHHCC